MPCRTNTHVLCACFRQRAGHEADLSNHREESVDFTTGDDEQVKLSVAATVTATNTRPQQGMTYEAFCVPVLNVICMAFNQDGQRPGDKWP
jgi:hypothetical protein